ncbi:hypothetical protein K445DRAFT_375098 [Daldinia sp. EC12]|nr:hypothetical protein K445DRAFT_375098 [Daldinia sp. EC12]
MYATLYGDFNLGSLEVGETGGTKYVVRTRVRNLTSQGFAASQLVRRTFASIRILEVRKQRLPEISEPHPFPTFNAGSLGSQPDLAGVVVREGEREKSAMSGMSTKQRRGRAWMQKQTQPRQSAGKKAHRQERTKQPRLNANKDHDRSDMVGYDELGIASPETCQVTPLSSQRNKVAPLFGNPRLLDGEGTGPFGGDGSASTSIS